MTEASVWRRQLADLQVHPLCLGGAVFGWTADEKNSVEVLDAYVEAGGNFIDTADAYMHWADGNSGGESEEIIGRWLASRGGRENLVISTKVGRLPPFEGLSRRSITQAIDGSLSRLGVDYVDLYYCHLEDTSTPLEETLEVLAELVRAGKVRHLGASNWSAERLSDALRLADAEGWPRFTAVQEWYSLVERGGFEGGIGRVCQCEGLACVSFASLAGGFLTGKYGPGTQVESVRAKRARTYLDRGGADLLAMMDEVADAHHTTVSAVALAWVATQRVVVSAAAAASTAAQLHDLLAFTSLELTSEELAVLGEVGGRVVPVERNIAEAF